MQVTVSWNVDESLMRKMQRMNDLWFTVSNQFSLVILDSGISPNACARGCNACADRHFWSS